MKTNAKTKGIGSVEANVEVTINAPQERVWEALVNETTHWWPKSFLTSERTKRFVIEPRLGGRVFEDFGGGEGATWYTVLGIDSPNVLTLVGHMGPPFGGPLATLLRLALTPVSSAETKLEITDAAFGQVAECDTESGWREVFDDNFRPYAESAKRRKK
jgi:uncharacterized protein YndB with AHSA1/START domain